jgi:hypothetical protein
VAVARCHSIAGPVRAAIPFTSAELPLAYLFLKAATKGYIKHKKIEEEFENEIANHDINSHFVCFEPFCG